MNTDDGSATWSSVDETAIKTGLYVGLDFQGAPVPVELLSFTIE